MLKSTSLFQDFPSFQTENSSRTNEICLDSEPTPERVGFVSIGSGSSGNCYYFSSPRGSLLIDVGVPIRKVEQALQAIGKSLQQIDAILITHGHSDHSRHVARLSVLYNLPVVATQEVFDLLDNLKSRFRIHPRNRVSISERENFSIGGFEVESFGVPHDFTGTVGYLLSYGTTFRLALLTDVGHYLPLHYSIARSCTHLILESNFDREMLINGDYPYVLKQRIASDVGHTGNYEAALFLSQVYHSRMQHVWLCHLSKDNNTPACCYQTFADILLPRGVELEGFLSILPRYKATPLYLSNPIDRAIAPSNESQSAEVAV